MNVTGPAAAFVVAFGAMAAAAGLPTQPVLPAALAAEAVAAAVEACARQGWRVAATVVDQGGVARAALRGDGAGPHTVDSSLKKAYTAASLGAPTQQYARLVAENPAAQGLRDMNERVLILGGGLPIKAAGDALVGGIGVGGAPGGDKDETCAAAGIAKIQDRLR